MTDPLDPSGLEAAGKALYDADDIWGYEAKPGEHYYMVIAPRLAKVAVEAYLKAVGEPDSLPPCCFDLCDGKGINTVRWTANRRGERVTLRLDICDKHLQQSERVLMGAVKVTA